MQIVLLRFMYIIFNIVKLIFHLKGLLLINPPSAAASQGECQWNAIHYLESLIGESTTAHGTYAAAAKAGVQGIQRFVACELLIEQL